MDCFRCRTPIPDTSRFCLSCGAAVSDPTAGGPTTAEMDEFASRQMEGLVREETKGEFEIQKELGRGGMAVVYLATETHLGRQVAIKVLPPDMTFGKGAIERFKREARTAATLDHPNIIPVYRITPGGRLFWYAMKFLEGRSLGDILEEKKRLSLDETIRILKEVAAALDYAHKRKVVHRDIKPANVMIDPEDRVVLTDFGIAKELAAGSLTASGSVLGTPFYMSPEQCTGGELTGAADQYSVGIMAYQMLSGQLPFDSNSIPDLLHKHCLEPPPPLEILLPRLPPYVYMAINRALAKKPADRFPTVGAFVAALQRPSAQVATAPAPRRRSLIQRLVTTTEAPRGKPRVRKSLYAVPVVLVAGVGGYLLWAGAGPSRQVETPAKPTTDTVATSTARADTAIPTALASRPPVSEVIPDTAAKGNAGAIGDTTRGAPARKEPARTVQPVSSPTRSNPPSARPAPPKAAAADTSPAGRQVAQPGQRLGVVQVRVLPWANLQIDGANRGAKTVFVDSIIPGTHALRFTRDGFVTVDTNLILRPGKTTQLQIAMKRAGTP